MSQYWRTLRETFVCAAASVPIAATINHSICSVARIEGVSMQPALNPDYGSTDYVLVNKTKSCYRGGVERGDVVIITSPRDPSQLLVKRIIAIEGDWIRNRLDQTLTRVPASKIWVEGDNNLPGHFFCNSCSSCLCSSFSSRPNRSKFLASTNSFCTAVSRMATSWPRRA